MSLKFGNVNLEDDAKYYRIPLNLYSPGDVVKADIYMVYQGEHILFRPKGKRWETEDETKLVEFGIHELFVRCQDDKEHFKFVEQNLDSVLTSKETPIERKATVLHQAATGIAQGIFDSPSSTETMTRTKSVVEKTMGLVANDTDAFLQMISLSSHDYYTYTHCVNVMTFTIGLLTNLGVKDQRMLREAAMGAFLHDIGKSKVPLKILNKPGPLTEEEWGIMKKHPEFGVDALGKNVIPDRGKQVILQHHEKLNGVGYPFGLRGGEIELISQVVSITDAYDAMTTDRCYSKAMPPIRAFEIITQQMRGHFASNIVENFIRMLNLKKLR